MLIVVSCSIIALFLTFLESRGQMKGGMKWGFIIVTILGAIHYDYGNDYMTYLRIYNEVVDNTFNLKSILAGNDFREPGWALLCWLFKPIGGFFMMVAVLNIIQNYIVYKFIKKNVEQKMWPLSVFIYLFSTDLYLLSFSMMRQMFVMIALLGMWEYIIARKWWIPIIVLYLCSYIHSSAIVLLPFAFFGFIPMSKAKYLGIGYLLLFVVLLLSRNVLEILFKITSTLDDSLSEYVDAYTNDVLVLSKGLGFAISMIPFALSIYFIFSKNNKGTFQAKALVTLNAFSFIIALFAQIIYLVYRIGFYFEIFGLASFPIIYGNIRNGTMRLELLLLYILFTIYNYYMFFVGDVFSEKYSTFHTIFGQI